MAEMFPRGDKGLTNVSLTTKDWRVLQRLRDKRGESFKCGVIVHTGHQTIPLGDRLFAVPLSALWA